MRRIYDNGVYRDMTPEEIAELQSMQMEQPIVEPTIEERVSALEEELVLSKILLGVSE